MCCSFIQYHGMSQVSIDFLNVYQKYFDSNYLMIFFFFVKLGYFVNICFDRVLLDVGNFDKIRTKVTMLGK